MGSDAFGVALAALFSGMIIGYVIFLIMLVCLIKKIGWKKVLELINPFY